MANSWDIKPTGPTTPQGKYRLNKDNARQAAWASRRAERYGYEPEVGNMAPFSTGSSNQMTAGGGQYDSNTGVFTPIQTTGPKGGLNDLAAATQPTPTSWTPSAIPSSTGIDYTALLSSLFGGANKSLGQAFNGGGGGGGQWVHNPQPAYFPYYHNSGIGFSSGFGWAQTNQQNNARIPGTQTSWAGDLPQYAQGSGGWAGDMPQYQMPAQQAVGGGYAVPATTSTGGYTPVRGGSSASAAQSSGGITGTGNPILDIAKMYQDAMDRSNAANEQRYNDIISGRQNMFDTAMQYIDKYGNAQRTDINDQFDKLDSQITTANVARGMANSTVNDTMKKGNLIDRTKAIGRLEDQLTAQRLGYQTSLQGDLLNFMERRDDNGPDPNQLLQLAMLMGQGGIGAGQQLGGAATGGGGGGGAAGIGGINPFAAVGQMPFGAMNGFGGPNGFAQWGGNQGGGWNGGGGNQGNWMGWQNQPEANWQQFRPDWGGGQSLSDMLGQPTEFVGDQANWGALDDLNASYDWGGGADWSVLDDLNASYSW